MFSKVLIANRGEIALRVARTCQEMGIATVAVHSTEDRDSAVVRFADEAVQIGPAAPRRSYLNMPAIIEAALQTGAEAIHPGYGFLSEDADFADVCETHGVTFVGPGSAVMARLADKATVRGVMAEAGLPVLPGSTGTLDSAVEARHVASRIGYPVLIKAAAGGGGRGMCVVRDPRDLVRAHTETRAHANAVFGDGRVYLERFVDSPRHVEVQVLRDSHGNTVHLGARDCSVQRRHQKLVEETPVPALPAGLVAEMCALAVRGADAVGYVGVGTFEFLVGADGTPTFMEVNCRIQVEHPVTEMVTGIDLVRQQLNVAWGLPLRFRQDEIEARGWSIECRVNAEDPDRAFAPAPGTLNEFTPPGGPFTRVDAHGAPGLPISAQYDSLLAKVIVWGPDREQAIARMDRALSEFRIAGPGVRTTIAFLRQILMNSQFQDAKHSTTLVNDMLQERLHVP